MIKHLVLFKLAEEAEGKTKTENSLIVKEKLEALKQVIPVIRKIEVFSNHPHASSENYDVVLEVEFNSMDDLKIYAVHPEHLKVVEFITKVKTGRTVIDYEI